MWITAKDGGAVELQLPPIVVVRLARTHNGKVVALRKHPDLRTNVDNGGEYRK
jgi:hypothetical protein